MEILALETASCPTLSQTCAARLRRLCDALNIGSRTPETLALVNRMTSPWGQAFMCDAPHWPSPVGDDQTPFEFSLGLSDSPELRFLVEPLGAVPSLQSNRRESLALLRSLSQDYAIDLSRLELVKDLFLPGKSAGSFALCIAVAFQPKRPPQFKAYLDPEALGKGLAAATVEEALFRLGLGACWPVVARALMRRGPDLDEVKYLSLDLSSSAGARVKVYVRHHHCTPSDLTKIPQMLNLPSAELERFIELIVPECKQTFYRRAPLTCAAVSREQGGRLATITTHIPVNSYAPDDAVIEARVLSCLSNLGIEGDSYSRSLHSYAGRSLGQRRGAQSYVSLTLGSHPRLTVYLAAEAYRAGYVAQPPALPHERALGGLLTNFETVSPITFHPFLRRLQREQVNLRNIWRLLGNFQVSISGNFSRWLAQIVARVNDARVRCLLVEQLSDEMGRGNFERAHVNLFDRMMKDLECFRPPMGEIASVLEPGRRLERELEEIYCAPDVREAVGAVMVGEIFGKQIDQFLGAEFRRQSIVAAESLDWLVLHEQLEVAHADASVDLAGLIPPEDVDAVYLGGMRIFRAGWRFLDDLYAQCYGVTLD